MIKQTTTKLAHSWLAHWLPFLHWLPLLNRQSLAADVTAGLVAGILIIPQAIALATLSGMPPEYGFYTAIFPVIVVSLFGSSWHVLSGPNTAVAILTTSILQIYASPFTPDYIAYVITLTFMVGVLQLGFGLLRLGVVFNYFSYTVMVALITGVGIIIMVQSISPFLGLMVNIGEPLEDTLYQLAYSIQLINPYAAGIGLITVVSGFLAKKYTRFPPLIAAVVIGMLASFILELFIGSASTKMDKLGFISFSALPLSVPDFSPETFAIAQQGMIVGAISIAFLALMQSAIIARSMAVSSGQHVNMNQEIVGHGLSNIAGGFLSCFVSCGSFNRSAANLESGAVTPLVGIISAFVLGFLVYFASDILAFMPMALMAGVLILVGWGLIDGAEVKKLLSMKTETRVIFLLTLGTTLYGGVQNGVFLGLFLSVVSYLRNVSKPEIQVLTGERAEQYYPLDFEEGNVLLISGSLFFGSVPALENALMEMEELDEGKEHLYLSMRSLQNIDQASLKVFIQEAHKRAEHGKRLVMLLESDKLYQRSLKQHGYVLTPGRGGVFSATLAEENL